MDVEERFAEAVETLERRFVELAEAGRAAEQDASTWGGWSVRFNQRLLADRQRLAIVLEPPEGADPRLLHLYGAAVSIRDLWEAMNSVIQGAYADVAGAQVAVEDALSYARAAIPHPDPHA